MFKIIKYYKDKKKLWSSKEKKEKEKISSNVRKFLSYSELHDILPKDRIVHQFQGHQETEIFFAY